MHYINVILFDSNRESFYPLSYSRPIAEIRLGILTIKEKWEHYYKNVSIKTESYLNQKFPLNQKNDNLWINSSITPNQQLITEINALRKGELLEKNNLVIAFRSSTFNLKKLNYIKTTNPFTCLSSLQDIFLFNSEEIIVDFYRITQNKFSTEISSTNNVLGNKIYIHETAKVECCNLNAKSGPIFIGKNVEIMEGSSIRGPIAICESSVIKMNAKLYGGTTIGPFCKIGGEVNNVIFLGYSSKSHDGFLGNSVVGEWCNFGADSNNSNLKNNYANVKLWSYKKESFESTDLQFCGLFMGDHAKCGINTMFNTGTIVGVAVNIFGSGFVRNYIPSFSWGGRSGFILHKKEKFFETARKVMRRRDKDFTQLDKDIFANIFDMTKRYRNFD